MTIVGDGLSQLSDFAEEMRRKTEQKLEIISKDLLKAIVAKSPQPAELLDIPTGEPANALEVYHRNYNDVEKIIGCMLRNLAVAKTVLANQSLDFNDLTACVFTQETVDHYKKKIEEAYDCAVEMFKKTVDSMREEFESLFILAQKNFDCGVINGMPNIFINFLYIVIGPVTKICNILSSLEDKLRMLAAKCYSTSSNKEAEKSRIAAEIGKLLREWQEEESLIGEKQFDLINALDRSDIEEELRDSTTDHIGRLNDLNRAHNVSSVRLDIYSNLTNDNFEWADVAKNIGKCKTSIEQLTAEMNDFHKAISREIPRGELIIFL
ncbi:unnamed protein product [Caenorhabditis sp. 36 PRJEB53466]|nr:unnamed protein product [Caenorhabditis sp. 36 PRJEB53466]